MKEGRREERPGMRKTRKQEIKRWKDRRQE